MKRQVQVGRIPIGEEAPVSIQSMTNTNTTDVVATVSQILALEKAGCDIVRVTIPDKSTLCEPFKRRYAHFAVQAYT